MTWLKNALQTIIDWFAGIAGTVTGWVLDIVWWVIDSVVELLQQLINLLVGLLPAEARMALNGAPWETMGEYIDDINWFIPVYGILGVVMSTLGVAGSIRLLRWFKSFIPTVGD